MEVRGSATEPTRRRRLLGLQSSWIGHRVIVTKPSIAGHGHQLAARPRWRSWGFRTVTNNSTRRCGGCGAMDSTDP